MVMGGTTAQDDWYREQAKDIMGEFITRGNYWIAQKVQKGDHKGKAIDFDLTCIYAIKGKYAVEYSKNISPAEVEQYRIAWSDSIMDNASSDKRSDPFVTKVYHMFDKYKAYHELPRDEVNQFGDRMSAVEQLFKEVRTCTYKQFYLNFHKSPFPQMYKQTSATIFTMVCERLNCLDQGIEVLLKSWY